MSTASLIGAIIAALCYGAVQYAKGQAEAKGESTIRNSDIK